MDNSNQQLVSPPQPTIEGTYGHGWRQMKKYFLELLLIAFVMVIIQVPLGWYRDIEDWEQAVSFTEGLMALAYWLLIAIPIEYGVYLIYLKVVRGEKFEFRDLITAFNQFIDVILSRILVMGIIAIGIFLLIIPGIVFAVRLSMVPFLVMDKKLDAVSAVKESWRLTKGHGWTIFGMALLAIPIFLGGLIAFIVGVIVALIWIEAAFASMYFAISGTPAKEAEVESTD